MRAQPVRCSRPGVFVDGKDWIGLRSVTLSLLGHSAETRITMWACQRRSFSIFTAQASFETLDRLAPMHDIASRYRSSTPWFDADCRSIKRGARMLERRYRRTKDPLDRLAWIRALRDKHATFKSKENEYWENMVRSNSSNPKKLWRSVQPFLENHLSRQPTFRHSLLQISSVFSNRRLRLSGLTQLVLHHPSSHQRTAPSLHSRHARSRSFGI